MARRNSDDITAALVDGLVQKTGATLLMSMRQAGFAHPDNGQVFRRLAPIIRQALAESAAASERVTG